MAVGASLVARQVMADDSTADSVSREVAFLLRSHHHPNIASLFGVRRGIKQFSS